jgi:acrylyl-CoA reductase (NADPH)
MALGTAGFTAALGIVRMEENGLQPEQGPLIVTGATGGVGSLAVDMLAARGYQVTALTGKESRSRLSEGPWRSEVMFRSALDPTRIQAARQGALGGRRR